MIIDAILDRKDAEQYGDFNYDPRKFYNYINQWAADGMKDAIRIVHAMDELEERDVKDALCLYIIHREYNLQIIDYVNSRVWLTKTTRKPKKFLIKSRVGDERNYATQEIIAEDMNTAILVATRELMKNGYEKIEVYETQEI